MNMQNQQEIYQEGPVQYHRRRNPWFAILLALMSIPLIIGGISLLVFAGLTIAGVTLLVLTILLLVVGTSLLIAAAVYFALSTIHIETRKFTVGEHPRVVVNNEIGTFHINAGSDANSVTIQATHHSRRFWKRAPKSRVRYEQLEESNLIKARVDRVLIPGLNFPQHIDFDIIVPGNADLELTTGVGDIWVTGISGQVTLRSDTGSIYVRRGLLTGNSLLKTDLGSLNLHEAIDSSGTFTLTAGTGSINVVLPGEAAFELDASTSLGSITTNAPGMTIAYSTNRELHGAVGSPPRASLILRTSIGSINVYEESHGHYPTWKKSKRS